MRFLTPDECRAWGSQTGYVLDERGVPCRPSTKSHHVRRDVPQSFTRLTAFCRHLEASLRPRQACLFWVTDWGIWEENLQLYYRLRQSYQDPRLLHEAPGHLFLEYEGADLVSFFEGAVLCGWDVHLLPTAGYAQAFVSHDEFVEFASDEHNPGLITEFTAWYEGGTSGAAV